MRQVRVQCGVGNLVRMDSDFFCQEFRAFTKRDNQLQPEKRSELYASWNAIEQAGPFDVIVLGTSVGDTGWVPIVENKMGLKILNLTRNPRFRSRWPNVYGDLMERIDAINHGKPVYLLYVTLTERRDLDFRLDSISESKKLGHPDASRITSFFWRLVTYVMTKGEIAKNPRVSMMPIQGKQVLFHEKSLKGNVFVRHYGEDDLKKIAQHMRGLSEEAFKMGAKLGFVAFPTKAEQYHEELAKQDPIYQNDLRENAEVLKTAAKLSKIPFLDLYPLLKSRASRLLEEKGQLLWFDADTHMNRLGAQETADIVTEFLKNNIK